MENYFIQRVGSNGVKERFLIEELSSSVTVSCTIFEGRSFKSFLLKFTRHCILSILSEQVRYLR